MQMVAECPLDVAAAVLMNPVYSPKKTVQYKEEKKRKKRCSMKMKEN